MSYVQTTKEQVKSVTEIESDQDLIRSALIAELDAVSLYVSDFRNLHSERAKEVIFHILNEEKEHITELYCVLSSLDEEQNNLNRKVSPKTCIIK